jgi:hypothetical protein
MPAEREQSFRIQGFNHNLELKAFVRLLRFRDLRVHGRTRDSSGKRAARNKGTIELHPEPTPEFRGIRQRSPHPLDRRAQENLLLDAICNSLSNLSVAY